MKETVPKVSVVFPIYNNENYLERCVQSVLNQTLQDIELILVDDGSTDNASKIIDKFAEKDRRIRVVHKENEGSAAARNQGLNMAKGEYVAFVESDDYVADDMYEKLYQRAEATNADIVKCGFWHCAKNAQEEFDKFYDLVDEFEVFRAEEHPEIFQYHASIWAALYRRSFLDNYSLRFLVTPKATYSDFSWRTMTYAYAKRITILHMPLYYYTFDNPKSSHFMTGERYQYIFYHINESNRILREANVYDAVKEDVAVQVFNFCSDAIYNVAPALRRECFEGFRALCQDMFGGKFKYRNFNARQRNLIDLALKNEFEKFYELFLMEYIMCDPYEFEGKKLVLFGAGKCGQSYLLQLKKMNIPCIKVVDNSLHFLEGVDRPDCLVDMVFDKILISVVNKNAAEDIKRQLLAMGITEEKIVWKLPMKLC